MSFDSGRCIIRLSNGHVPERRKARFCVLPTCVSLLLVSPVYSISLASSKIDAWVPDSQGMVPNAILRRWSAGIVVPPDTL